MPKGKKKKEQEGRKGKTNNARSTVEYRDNGTTLTYSNLRLHLSSTENTT